MTQATVGQEKKSSFRDMEIADKAQLKQRIQNRQDEEEHCKEHNDVGHLELV